MKTMMATTDVLVKCGDDDDGVVNENDDTGKRTRATVTTLVKNVDDK